MHLTLSTFFPFECVCASFSFECVPGMNGAELLGHGTGRGRARVKVCGAGRGKKASKSTDFGQNWILPRNCLLNFIGFKLTLLRCTPQVLVIFTGRGRAKPPFYGVGRGGPCIPGAYAMFGL